MRFLLYKKLLIFFSKRRSRFSCFVGALFIAPALKACRNSVDYHKTEIERELTYLGRLELLQTLLYKWWSKE